MVYNPQETRAETTPLQRVHKVSQTFPHPVRVLLGACAAGKAPKVVRIGCEGHGREAVYTPVVLSKGQ